MTRTQETCTACTHNDSNVVILCPLHAAALDLLRAARRIVETALQSEAQKQLGVYSITDASLWDLEAAITKAEGREGKQ